MGGKREECEVCGEPATHYIGNAVLAVCDNVVCYHTRVAEVNTELKEMQHQEETEV